eukprot:4976689-Lingulodinium_polyedra.AAC.1
MAQPTAQGELTCFKHCRLRGARKTLGENARGSPENSRRHALPRLRCYCGRTPDARPNHTR